MNPGEEDSDNEDYGKSRKREVQIDSTLGGVTNQNGARVKGKKQAKIKLNRAKLPKGLRCMIYSWLTMTDLTDTICKLSKTDRTEIVESTNLDQPRNLKVLRVELGIKSSLFDYYMSLVNGYVMIPLNRSSNFYTLNFIMRKVAALAMKNHDIKLRVERWASSFGRLLCNLIFKSEVTKSSISDFSKPEYLLLSNIC